MFILPIGWQQSNKSKTSPQHLPRGCPGILCSTPNLPPILRLQQSWSWKSWEQEFLWRSSHSASTPSICLFHKGEEEGSFTPTLCDLVGDSRRLLSVLQSDLAEVSEVMLTSSVQRKWMWIALCTGKDERRDPFQPYKGLLGARLEPSSKRPCSQEAYHRESGKVEGPGLQVWEFVL